MKNLREAMKMLEDRKRYFILILGLLFGLVLNSCEGLKPALTTESGLKLYLEVIESDWKLDGDPYKHLMFRYTIKNNTDKLIYFNTLMSIDSSFEFNFFRFTIKDRTPPYGMFCRLNELTTKLTKQDTLRCIVKIPPFSSYSDTLKAYGCTASTLSTVSYAKSKEGATNSIKVQLYYDNRMSQQDSVWRGELYSNIIKY